MESVVFTIVKSLTKKKTAKENNESIHEELATIREN